MEIPFYFEHEYFFYCLKQYCFTYNLFYNSTCDWQWLETKTNEVTKDFENIVNRSIKRFHHTDLSTYSFQYQIFLIISKYVELIIKLWFPFFYNVNFICKKEMENHLKIDLFINVLFEHCLYEKLFFI